MYAGNWNHTRQQNIPDGPNTYPGHHYNNFNSSSGNNNLYYNNNGSRPQPQPNPQYPNHGKQSPISRRFILRAN